MDYSIKLPKFHTLIIVKTIQKQLEKNELLMHSLLSMYLDEGCSKYPSEQELLDYKAELYDLSTRFTYTRIGEEIQYKYIVKAVHPMYINDDNYTVAKIIEAFNILDKPILVNNTFSKSLMNKIKKKYRLEMNEYFSSTEALADESFMNHLFSGTIYESPKKESLADINNITNDDLYNFYKNLMNSQSTTIIEGNIDYETKNLINLNKLKKLSYRPIFSDEILKIVPYKSKQAYLSIFYDTKIKRNDIELVDLSFINHLLGGSSYSKLFKHVREENGLAYQIYSTMSINHEGLIIKAMINKNNLDIVLDKIKETFLTLLDDIDLEQLKHIFLNEELLLNDSMTYYYSQIINEKTFIGRISQEERINRIKNITLADLKTILSRLELKTIHLFGGDLIA